MDTKISESKHKPIAIWFRYKDCNVGKTVEIPKFIGGGDLHILQVTLCLF